MSVEDRRPHRAALYSVLTWAASTIGLVVAVEVSWWYLVPEALGLYAGTWFAVRGSHFPRAKINRRGRSRGKSHPARPSPRRRSRGAARRPPWRRTPPRRGRPRR